VAARWVPGNRPAASSLGSVLPARWAGKDGRQQHHFKLREKAEAKAAPAFAAPAPIASRGAPPNGSSSRSASAARGETPPAVSLPPKDRGYVVLVQREVRRRHDRIDLFRAHHPALLQLASVDQPSSISFSGTGQ
jgi:hypothetical protein